MSFSQFLEDFPILLSSVSTIPHEFLITGDFNIHVDDPTDSNALQFISLLNLANLTQHVSFPTHSHSHTLDLVITHTNSNMSPTFSYTPISPSDHLSVIYSLRTCSNTTNPSLEQTIINVYNGCQLTFSLSQSF